MKNTNTKKRGLLNYILLVVLILYSVILITLMLWGMITSLKSRSGFYSNKLWLPKGAPTEWAWDNYKSDYYGLPKNREVPFYCVQGNTDGKEALLVWLCSDDDFAGNHPTPSGYIHRDLYLHLPTVSQAEKVFDFFNANYDAWQKMLKEMDAKGDQWSPASGYETTGNSEFILNSYDEEDDKIKYLDLDGKEAKFRNASGWSWYNYRYMQIKHFPAFVEQ